MTFPLTLYISHSPNIRFIQCKERVQIYYKIFPKQFNNLLDNFSGRIKSDEDSSTLKQNCARVNDMDYIRQNWDYENSPLPLGDKETDFDG
jgi:hypothetical protein